MRFVDDHSIKFDDIIDRQYSFEAAEEAFKYLASGEHLGKVVIKLS
jgi:NADPH-dependent curcumin reductase CurA